MLDTPARRGRAGAHDEYRTVMDLVPITGMKISMLKRVIKIDPTFPQPVPITSRYRVYSLKAVFAWIESRRTQPPLPPVRPTADAQAATAKNSKRRSNAARG